MAPLGQCAHSLTLSTVIWLSHTGTSTGTKGPGNSLEGKVTHRDCAAAEAGGRGRVPQKGRVSTDHPHRTCTDALLLAGPGWLQSCYGCQEKEEEVSAEWAAF